MKAKSIIPLILILLACNKNKEQVTLLNDTLKKDQTVSEVKKDTVQEGERKNPEELSEIKYNISEIPKSIKYSGRIVASATWKDNNGNNLIFITETEERRNSEGNSNKELYSYHYMLNGDESRLLWKIQDFVKECPVDLSLSYIDGSLGITDVDNNGTGESTFLYRISCRGDVSPEGLKLMMHEGEKKYAIRGNMLLEFNGEKIGGEGNPDDAFKNAPKVFLEHAQQMWEKFYKQKN